MGWYYTLAPGKHRDLDAEVMKGYTQPDGAVVTFTDCRLVGFRSHWHVMRRDGVPVVIMHEMVEFRPTEWGYKPMDETFGPVNVDCPLALLDMVPPVPGDGQGAQWAREWRARVRAHHAARAAQTALFRSVQPGDEIRLQHARGIAPDRWLGVSAKGRGSVSAGGWKVGKRFIAEVRRAAIGPANLSG